MARTRRAPGTTGGLPTGISKKRHDTAVALIEESLSIQRELGARDTIARVLCNLGNVWRSRGRHAAARIYLEESLGLYRELRDERMITWQLVHLGDVEYFCGNFGSAKELLEEAVQRFRASDYPRGVSWALEAFARTLVEIDPATSVDGPLHESLEFFASLSERPSEAMIEFAQGREALRRGDLSQARLRLESCIETFREVGNGQGQTGAKELLGEVEGEEGNLQEAKRLFLECLESRRAVGDYLGAATVLERLAAHFPAALAARIYGATDSIRTSYECPPRPSDLKGQAVLRAKVRKELGETAYTAAWQSGARSEWEETIAGAMG